MEIVPVDNRFVCICLCLQESFHLLGDILHPLNGRMAAALIDILQFDIGCAKVLRGSFDRFSDLRLQFCVDQEDNLRFRQDFLQSADEITDGGTYGVQVIFGVPFHHSFSKRCICPAVVGTAENEHGINPVVPEKAFLTCVFFFVP